EAVLLTPLGQDLLGMAQLAALPGDDAVLEAGRLGEEQDLARLVVGGPRPPHGDRAGCQRGGRSGRGDHRLSAGHAVRTRGHAIRSFRVSDVIPVTTYR